MSCHILDPFVRDSVCQLHVTMGEFGVYDLHLNETDCRFSTAKDPVNIYAR